MASPAKPAREIKPKYIFCFIGLLNIELVWRPKKLHMADVVLKHAYKVYPNGTKAVNDFSIEIFDKEFIVFVGPSGCGKSTVLRMIAGLEEITAGELFIGGARVNDLEPKARDIAMVFQNYALYPHMTVFENMAFALKLRHIKRGEIKNRVEAAAEILGLSDYLDKKPSAMSGGQRQRVALGRAIVREPKVFLLDEPLSNLDAKLRTQMRTEITKLHRRIGTTFIYVTHDQVEAMTMGDRIVVMKDGYILQTDTPSNLYNFPENKFVAGFIGTPPMNFWSGRFFDEGNFVSFEFCERKIDIPKSKLKKLKKEYIDGRGVILGVRPENIIIGGEDGAMTCVVEQVEELGSETLVYCDFNTDAERGYDASPSKMTVRAQAGVKVKAGDILKVAFNLDNLCFFDAEKETTIMPRLPAENTVKATIKDGFLSILGEAIPLSPAIKLSDGEYSAVIPSDAINFFGGIAAKICKVENIGKKTLFELEAGGETLFAVFDGASTELENIKIGVELERVDFYSGAKRVFASLPAQNALDAVLKKVKGSGLAVDISVAGVTRRLPDITAKKLASAEKKPFGRKVELRFSTEDVVFGEGIAAKTEESLDFCVKKYAAATVDGRRIIIKDPGSESFLFFPDLENISVFDKELSIRLA